MIRLALLLVGAAGILLGSALTSVANVQDEEPPENWIDVEEAIHDSTFFSCRYESGKVIIDKAVDTNLLELAVEYRGDPPVYLLIAEDHPQLKRLGAISSAEYAAAERIELNVASTMGLKLVAGATPELAFSRHGIYSVISSPAIESDWDYYECIVSIPAGAGKEPAK